MSGPRNRDPGPPDPRRTMLEESAVRSQQSEQPPTGRVRGGRIAAGVVGLVALVLLGRQFGGLLPRFAEWVDGLGFWGPAVFIAGYVVTTVAFIPGAVMTLAAGAVFGLPRATVYVLAGATLGSAVAFLISRHLAREAIAARVAGNARFAAIDRAVGAQGFKMVLLMRLSPVFPYNLLNYSLGFDHRPLHRLRLRLDRHAPRDAALRLLRRPWPATWRGWQGGPPSSAARPTTPCWSSGCSRPLRSPPWSPTPPAGHSARPAVARTSFRGVGILEDSEVRRQESEGSRRGSPASVQCRAAFAALPPPERVATAARHR